MLLWCKGRLCKLTTPLEGDFFEEASLMTQEASQATQFGHIVGHHKIEKYKMGACVSTTIDRSVAPSILWVEKLALGKPKKHGVKRAPRNVQLATTPIVREDKDIDLTSEDEVIDNSNHASGPMIPLLSPSKSATPRQHEPLAHPMPVYFSFSRTEIAFLPADQPQLLLGYEIYQEGIGGGLGVLIEAESQMSTHSSQVLLITIAFQDGRIRRVQWIPLQPQITTGEESPTEEKASSALKETCNVTNITFLTRIF